MRHLYLKFASSSSSSFAFSISALVSVTMLSAFSVASSCGQTAGVLPVPTVSGQAGMSINLSDQAIDDLEAIQFGDAPEYNINDAGSPLLHPDPTAVVPGPPAMRFSDQPNQPYEQPNESYEQPYQWYEHSYEGQMIEQQYPEYMPQNSDLPTASLEDYPGENYLHLLHPPAEHEAAESEAATNVAKRQTPGEREISHCRAGSPLSLSRLASKTYGKKYRTYFVGGGVPAGRGYSHGEPRALNEGTWGVDYAPRYSRVASNWSHGKLYQGGIGQYEPDHKNRALSGQTLGRFFSKRERRHADEHHETHHHSEEHLEPLFETDVTDADSSEH